MNYRLAICVVLIAVFPPTVVPGQTPAPAMLPRQSEPTLESFGFPATIEGVRECLSYFSSGNEHAARIDQLFKDLGSSRFEEREAATESLISLPVLPAEKYRTAMESSDLEVRIRVDRIQQSRTDDRTEALIRAAMRTIVATEASGLMPELLNASVQLMKQEDWLQLVEALHATIGQSDESNLREAVSHASPAARFAAIRVLLRIVPDDAIAVLSLAMSDSDEHILTMLAQEFARRKHANCLPIYLRLMESEKLGTRLAAAHALRTLTEKKLGYKSNAELEARRESVRLWRNWLKEHRDEVVIRYPIEPMPNLLLYNEKDLSGWTVVVGGKSLPQEEAQQQWAARGEVLAFIGTSQGYLRTSSPIKDYKLTLEYRWPKGETNADSGLHLFQELPDQTMPKCLEVQMHTGNAGDFYSLGGFALAAGNTLRSGVRSRLADSSERPTGDWNKIEVVVSRGELTVKINDVLQNKASGCPQEPKYIAFRMERHHFEIRHLQMTPLDE